MSTPATVTVPTVTLSNGQMMPMLGIGTDRTHHKTVKLESALSFANMAGYTYVDAAWISLIDPSLRIAVEAAQKQLGISRDKMFLVCKLWNTFHSKEGVKVGLSSTLENVNLNYVDIFYINWPMGFKESDGIEPYPVDHDGNLMFSDVNYLETYKAVEEFVDRGVVKGIGLCHFNQKQLEDILKNCRIKPVVVQLECHPYFQNNEMIKFCQNNRLQVVSLAPLGDGDLAEWRDDYPKILQDPVLIELAQKYNKSPAQIVLRWHIQRGCIPVPKTLEHNEILENANIFNFELKQEDFAAIEKLDKNQRLIRLPQAKKHKYYPF